jgi:hypothetical protein
VNWVILEDGGSLAGQEIRPDRVATATGGERKVAALLKTLFTLGSVGIATAGVAFEIPAIVVAGTIGLAGVGSRR